MSCCELPIFPSILHHQHSSLLDCCEQSYVITVTAPCNTAAYLQLQTYKKLGKTEGKKRGAGKKEKEEKASLETDGTLARPW